MDLYQLKCVLTVAKYNNFSKASSELCVTPPSLSQQIKKIEKELNVELFERTTRSVKLTLAGIDFVEQANQIMFNFSNLKDTMKKHANGTIGTLAIGCVPGLKDYGIIHWVKLFTEAYPNISIEFHEAECYDLYTMLYNDEIDVAMLAAQARQKPSCIHLKSYPLVSDEFVIVTSSNHPLAKKGVINLKEVARDRFVLFSRSSSLFQSTVDACHQAGFMPEFTRFETQNIDTALGFVAENAGIALVPLNQVSRTHWENISIVHLSPKINQSFIMVSKKSAAHEKSVVKNFEDYILKNYNLPLVCHA